MPRRSWWVRLGCGSALVGATLAVFLFASRFHEFWRDETQAALIARAVPLSRLVPAMRTEAVPPILFLALKLIGGLPTPYSLSVLAPVGYAMLLFGTYRLLLTASGSSALSLLVTTALALTDTYFFELGVVVRQYGLGLGFALACVGFLGQALRSNLRSDARWGALFGALAVSTAVHPGCLAGAAMLTYSILRLAQRPTLRSVAEPLFALPAFLFTFYLIGPYDRAPEALAVRHPSFDEWIDRGGSVLLDSIACRGWWTGWQDAYDLDAPRLIAIAGAVVALVGLLIARFGELRRRRTTTTFYAVTFILNVSALMYIFVIRYKSSYRHHLFMFMPVMVVALAALLGPYRGSATKPLAPRLKVALLGSLAPWFAYQYFACATDLAGDRREPFSAAKAASEVFPRDARVVIAGEDWLGSGVLY
jgi:hypothetical protein